ncbi:signal peptidase II [Rhodobacter sp. SGA-6-6]|uniref:signal peptidase II n=1 Tax=Rhodobacter sp. SGA-6-6 TaxID=2710882 RepID=UPI0013EB4F5F|nr:signal peptidase II [Rhodobacter sp. SGA-6-6]NGM44099.1 signal peptidase II [Rhodobacter sp. SGA-6-6]
MRLLALSAALTFALDQATKLGVIHGLNLPERGEIAVLPPYLVFHWAKNYGINFGLLSGEGGIGRWLLIVVALAISAWVVTWVRREPANRIAQVSAGLLVGGALGNVVDRLAYGYVADFLNMSCCGIENPYAFNVADIAIFAGALGLVAFSGRPAQGGKGGRRRTGKPARKTP